MDNCPSYFSNGAGIVLAYYEPLIGTNITTAGILVGHEIGNGWVGGLVTTYTVPSTRRRRYSRDVG